ncbi:MAG: hypothetical protein D6795_08940 [Deltaproteobacteria bacterium]|nr:MAG: hypothetical protein D6795_08940 [Deltaproteobacteria bacterium]
MERYLRRHADEQPAAQGSAPRRRPFRFLLLVLLPLIVAIGGIVWFFQARPQERVRNAAVEREAKTEEKKAPARRKPPRVSERRAAMATAKRARMAETPPALPDVPEEKMGDLPHPRTDSVAKRRPPFKRPRLRSPKLSRIYEKRHGERASRKLGIKPGEPLRIPRPAPTPPIEEMAAAPRVEGDIADPLPEDIAPYDEDLAMAADDAAADDAAADDGFDTGVEPGEEYPEGTEPLEAEEDY